MTMPYRVVPGAPESPVILHVPHASRVLTRAARERILLDDAALTAELDRMTDAHTDVVAARVAMEAATTPWRFVNRYSRLVVDPERFPDEREELRAVGMGAVYTRTSHGAPLRAEDPDHARELLATHFEPYATALAVQRALGRPQDAQLAWEGVLGADHHRLGRDGLDELRH